MSTTSNSRPNVVVILADDLGYSDLGCFGGEIPTPHLDGMAESGARFTQFYTTARCSPSRASLLTGLHPHQTGVGVLTAEDSPVGYGGSLNRRGLTIAEILSQAGYSTSAIGKWHLASDVWKPNDAWPTRRGFDYFYGTLTGCGSFYDPSTLVRGEEPIPDETRGEDYYYTDAITDEAIGRIRHAAEASAPFFLYVAYTAPHWPLHARDEDLERVRGSFDEGWDALRAQRFSRQKELGIVSAEATLSPRDSEELAWEDVEHPEWQASRMEAYAAQVLRMDDGVGRIMAALGSHGISDNTLVVFLSDNGASPEEIPHIRNFEERDFYSPLTKDGVPVRLGNSPDIVPGAADTYASYGRPWANLSNTPFRLYKKWAHEGGIAAPFIIRWPDGGIPGGRIVQQPQQLTNVLPALLEACGVDHPAETMPGVLPPEGGSLLPLAAEAQSHDSSVQPLFFEHSGNAGVRDGEWKLVREYGQKWELYNLRSDPTELNDLVEQHPDVARALYEQWVAWADRVGVRDFERIVDLYELRGGDARDAAG